MAQASQLSPELARGLLQLARALLVAARNWTMYPPEHPTVGVSVSRLVDAIRESSLGAAFSIGITPETLMVEGVPADPNQSGIAEAAALLHDRDLVHITCVGQVPPEAIHAFLRVLALDPAERRRRGGPAVVWATEGHPSLLLDQIDYQEVLAREEGEVTEPAKRDDLWRSIVMSIAGGRTALFDERAQQRLLSIAGSAADVVELAQAVGAPKCGADGSPMITTQAATVLAAFRHLTSIVSVMAPERLPEVMQNLATAATQLDPHVVMEMMQTEEPSGSGVGVVSALAGAFDDMKVAQLLATALALDGQASDRLATIFNTIAPDEDRKRRVLTMTRSLLSETDFGKSGQFRVLWSSMEELLVSYNEKPFVSDSYRAALDGAGGRAERMSSGDLPSELPEWMDSLGQANVRALSVQMLIDLLTLAPDESLASQIAADMEALTEDLLLSGAYDDALTVARALAERAKQKNAVGRDGCRQALDRLGESVAMRETASLIGDVDEAGWNAIRSMVQALGASTIEALKPLVAVEQRSPSFDRSEELIVGFGAQAVSRVASLLADTRWFVQQNGARLLGRIAAPEAVPFLQTMLRQSSDTRLAAAAVSALGQIQDPAAARAVQTVLRAATGALRTAVVDALVADRNPRVVPMLLRIVEDSQPLGKDHEVVLGTVSALGQIGSDQAVPALTVLAAHRRFFGGKKLRALKEASVDALAHIGTPKAESAMREASKTGDRMLKQIVANRHGSKER